MLRLVETGDARRVANAGDSSWPPGADHRAWEIWLFCLLLLI